MLGWTRTDGLGFEKGRAKKLWFLKVFVSKCFGFERFWFGKVLASKSFGFENVCFEKVCWHLMGSIWFTIPRSAHSMRRHFVLALLSESAATQEQRLHRLLTTARHKP